MTLASYRSGRARPRGGCSRGSGVGRGVVAGGVGRGRRRHASPSHRKRSTHFHAVRWLGLEDRSSGRCWCRRRHRLIVSS